MVYLALINQITYRPGINEIGDYVDCFEGELSPTEGERFTLIKVEGLNKAEMQALLTQLVPQRNDIWRAKTDKWSDERPEEKKAWKHADDKWYFLEKNPKYQLTFQGLTPEDLAKLESKTTSLIEREESLNKVQKKIPMFAENLTEVKDLN